MRPLRILIVEDESDSANALTLLLKPHGHEVALACDGPGGIEEATRNPPDVVLLDIGLPGFSGYEVAARIRQLPAQRPFIIATTGYGDPAARDQSKAAEIDLHLVKPVNPEELLRLLQYWLHWGARTER
jgi:CheY-like chemotaxis protein